MPFIRITRITRVTREDRRFRISYSSSRDIGICLGRCLHVLARRLARWLLQILARWDRVGRPEACSGGLRIDGMAA